MCKLHVNDASERLALGILVAENAVRVVDIGRRCQLDFGYSAVAVLVHADAEIQSEVAEV